MLGVSGGCGGKIHDKKPRKIMYAKYMEKKLTACIIPWKFEEGYGVNTTMENKVCKFKLVEFKKKSIKKTLLGKLNFIFHT